MLGLKNNNEYYWEPTKIDYFTNYKVHRAYSSFIHSVVEATPNDGLRAVNQIFTMGRPEEMAYVGVTTEEYKDENAYIFHLKQFDNLSVS